MQKSINQSLFESGNENPYYYHALFKILKNHLFQLEA